MSNKGKPLSLAELEKKEDVKAMELINNIAGHIRLQTSVGNGPARLLRTNRVMLSKRQLTRLTNLAVQGMKVHAERGESQEVLIYAEIVRVLKFKK